MKFKIGFGLFLFLVSACTIEKKDYKTTSNDPEFLHRSVKEVTDRIVHDIFSPPVASRIYAYTCVAAYEAARWQNPEFMTLAGQLNGLDSLPKPEPNVEYCFSLASVEAALKVGTTLVFSEVDIDLVHEQIMKEYRLLGIPDDVYERSVDFGDKVAAHVIDWLAKDNYKQSRSFPKYTILSDAETWKPTPPAYMDAVEPHWNKIRPFAIDSASQFMPARPTPFSVSKTSQFYKEANEVYQIGLNLSTEQRMIASFWDCNPFVMNVKGHVMFATKKISPGGHWMNITRVVSTGSKSDFAHVAEAYARVSISLADAFISCWDEKYRSKLIRPETFINQYIDENWVPLLQTPPFPEYTSGHSVISNSAAVALTDLYGDNFAFNDSTEVEYGMPARKFTSFHQAAEEATISRVYGGIHYMPACQVGSLQGKALGSYIRDKIVTNNKLIINK